MLQKKIVKQFIHWLVTMGYIGYLPMPGTSASFITLVGLMICSIQIPIMFQWLGIVIIVYGAIRAINIALPQFSSTDPSAIVLDEGVGILVTFVGIDLTYSSAMFGFILFRFFDIVKPCGIKKLEKYKGALGIVGDDVAAGIISNVLLWVICRLLR